VPDAAGVVIGVYSPEESEEALALERLCVQGISYRLSFRRSTFHRRAENFPEWRIFTARLEGRLVGVAAGAVKEVLLHGQPTRASFFFDLRVHPAFRGRGIARRLAVEAKAWGRARASFSYTYTLADNRVARHLAEVFGGVASICARGSLTRPLPPTARPCGSSRSDPSTRWRGGSSRATATSASSRRRRKGGPSHSPVSSRKASIGLGPLFGTATCTGNLNAQ